MNARILVVEDEKAIQLALSGLLRREGYEVEVAGTGEDALARLRDTAFDLVITDLALGRGISGMDVLREVKELRAETLVVMITAHGSESIAVEAMMPRTERTFGKVLGQIGLRRMKGARSASIVNQAA